MSADRELVLEILRRMREAENMAYAAVTDVERAKWSGRARAFDECYTELKGRGYGDKP